jgi:hypothetical protein
MGVHVIPVPLGWSPEQAWEHISRGLTLDNPYGEPNWAVVEVEGVQTRVLADGSEQVTAGRLVRLHGPDDAH